MDLCSILASQIFQPGFDLRASPFNCRSSGGATPVSTASKAFGPTTIGAPIPSVGEMLTACRMLYEGIVIFEAVGAAPKHRTHELFFHGHVWAFAAYVCNPILKCSEALAP